MLIWPPIPPVPFYSQFENISLPFWRGKSCGVTDLAMLINYYEPGTTTPDTVLALALADKAYIDNIGWTYAGLIDVAKEYGLEGAAYDLGNLSTQEAFAKFKIALQSGPVIASIHYKFDPKSIIPHLVVITSVQGDTMYYNDPAADKGEKEILVENFLKGWKKRYVVIRPPDMLAASTSLKLN